MLNEKYSIKIQLAFATQHCDIESYDMQYFGHGLYKLIDNCHELRNAVEVPVEIMYMAKHTK